MTLATAQALWDDLKNNFLPLRQQLSEEPDFLLLLILEALLASEGGNSEGGNSSSSETGNISAQGNELVLDASTYGQTVSFNIHLTPSGIADGETMTLEVQQQIVTGGIWSNTLQSGPIVFSDAAANNDTLVVFGTRALEQLKVIVTGTTAASGDIAVEILATTGGGTN
jgi:hypothetical protein